MQEQSVTQITIVEVAPDSQAEALELMGKRAEFMEQQPGYLSIRIFRSLDRKRIVNVIEWQSRELLQQAHDSPDFREEWSRFDRLTESIDPHLYEHVV
jgi:heme-degrading monooxygenase HmoA